MKKIEISLNKKQIILLIVNIAFLLAYVILTVCAHKQTEGLYSQQEAARWENGKMSYAQVSAFISPGRQTGAEELASVRSAIATKLTKDSYSESKTGGRVWIDGYSGEVQAAIRKDTNTLNVTAVGVGGNFFQFHPMELLSGSYISDDDLNNDRVVVDENLAWALYGSNDIVGMQLWMNNTIYTVAGVVKVPEDGLEKTAYGNSNRIYMPYDQLKTQQDSLSITCYEVVLPNPISNYAYYTVRSAFGFSEEEEEQLDQEENPLCFDNVEILENSNRFELMPMLTKLKQWRLRSMRTSSIGYPYWENIARSVEDEGIIFLIFRILVLICPVVCLAGLLWHMWRHRSWSLKGLCVKGIDRIREKQEVRREEKLRQEEEDKQFEEVPDEDLDNFEDTGRELVEGTEEAEEYKEAEQESEEEIDTEEYIDITPDDSQDSKGESDEEEPELQAVTDQDLFQE